MKPSRYNIRVYGLWINENKEVLVTDEIRMGMQMTKFPGGGHELGEGLENALKREWMEELSVEIELDKLFYINDFLQISAFNPQEQILSVYYLIHPTNPFTPETKKRAFDFDHSTEGSQIFRWIPLSGITSNHFTFPIDKKVAELLQITP